MTRLNRHGMVRAAIAALMIAAVAVVTFRGAPASAVETPVSSGAPATVDTPILRLPLTSDPITIDGRMEPGEWEDASALSGFWYDFAMAKFLFLAPQETQVKVYGCFDNENLYIAYVSHTFPVGAFLKARGRITDVISHSNYGLQWDDHVELEIRPYDNNTVGLKKGLFKWYANPIGTIADSYWTQRGGFGKRWQSRARVASGTDDRQWVVEFAIPLESLVSGNYDGTEDGEPIVRIPPPDGTAYRTWFTRGMGGNGEYFNVFDKHMWNTTKTRFIFDRDAPSFKIKELGPMMKDIIDVTLEVKNHSQRSRTVRIGFFVENAAGTIYSSFESPELNEGRLELTPGEVKEIRLRQPFPGISRDGNTLWFDVRSSGTPAKTLFRTRLIDFHSMEGGVVMEVPFRTRRLDNIEEIRPMRRDFDVRFSYSPYEQELGLIVDRAIYGASPDAQKAVEAKVIVSSTGVREQILVEDRAEFSDAFAMFRVKTPALVRGETYAVEVLLFDKDLRIVGAFGPEEFVVGSPMSEGENDPTGLPWLNNEWGKGDVVWEPFTPIERTRYGFETLKHRFTIDSSGLPAQIDIKVDPRDVPLPMRGTGAEMTDEQKLDRGRGPQLRKPMRLEYVNGGERAQVRVVEPAKVVEQGKSFITYESKLEAGPVAITLRPRYEVDGSMHLHMRYDSKTGEPVSLDMLELVTDIAGRVDMRAPVISGAGMAGADMMEIYLEEKEGILWNSADSEPAELYYSKHVPFIFLGSGDRGFSWMSTTDKGMLLDKDSSAMHIERDAEGHVTWKTQFINTPQRQLDGEREIDVIVQVHPTKPKPENWRKTAWHYRGDMWSQGYGGPTIFTDAELLSEWQKNSGAPADAAFEDRKEYRDEGPAWNRWGQWRNVGLTRELDEEFEDKIALHIGRQIKLARRPGWWWDETWPGYRTSDLADPGVYYRDPEQVGENELPYQEAWTHDHIRNALQRIAKVAAEENVPQRSFVWANHGGTAFEAFAWDTQMIEGAGAMHNSYDIDGFTFYPVSMIRHLAKGFSGLIPRIAPDAGLLVPGDDPRYVRQLLGRALTEDAGLIVNGAHANIRRLQWISGVLRKLTAFGFWDDMNVEFLPYWRNGQYVRFNGETGADMDNRTYTSVYRAKAPGSGDPNAMHAIISVINVQPGDVVAPLEINEQALLGGKNTLTVGDIHARKANQLEGRSAQLFKQITEGAGSSKPALMDLETGQVIQQQADGTYGPIYVRDRSSRIFYLRHGGEGAPLELPSE